jgi:release factor glutamine methyltransferase
MQMGEVVRKASEFFKAKGIESSRLDSELLVGHALGLSRVQIYMKFDQNLDEAELSRCRALVARRAKGEPVAYIMNQKEFYGSNFFVDARVLIPRPETEQIVEQVISWASLAEFRDLGRPLRIVDLGCGSGCIGLSIAKKLRDINISCEVLLVDISADALAVAKMNYEKLKTPAVAATGMRPLGGPRAGVNGAQHEKALRAKTSDIFSDAAEGESKAFAGKSPVSDLTSRDRDILTFHFLQADAGELALAEILKIFGGPVDITVGNPPYIDEADIQVMSEVRKFEPGLALFAKNQGLACIEAWSKAAYQWSRQGSRIIFEIGAGQGVSASALLSEPAGWRSVQVIKDLSGLDRFVSAAML